MATINIMSLKAARAVSQVSTGNNKMPGTTFALDAFACGVGSKLANVRGTTCFDCYARKTQAARPNLQVSYTNNQQKTVAALETPEGTEAWVNATAAQIIMLDDTAEHRWLDYGDAPSAAFFHAITEVARRTPQKRHWCPTREVGHLAQFLAEGGSIPDNMVIRVSATKVDGRASAAFAHVPGILTSSVHQTRKLDAGEVQCDAWQRGHKCGDCRACWDRNIANVSYPLNGANPANGARNAAARAKRLAKAVPVAA